MTPKKVWEDIKQYIPTDKVIWESFFGDGKSGKYLQELGFTVIHENIDFFKENRGDIIVSNPPFSLKEKVLTRMKELNKPFILIMPISTITTQYCQKLFKNELQIIIPKKRIQFNKIVDGKEATSGHSSFDCVYVCYKIDLIKDITYLV